jgi:hypothetical protein
MDTTVVQEILQPVWARQVKRGLAGPCSNARNLIVDEVTAARPWKFSSAARGGPIDPMAARVEMQAEVCNPPSRRGNSRNDRSALPIEGRMDSPPRKPRRAICCRQAGIRARAAQSNL